LDRDQNLKKKKEGRVGGGGGGGRPLGGNLNHGGAKIGKAGAVTKKKKKGAKPGSDH